MKSPSGLLSSFEKHSAFVEGNKKRCSLCLLITILSVLGLTFLFQKAYTASTSGTATVVILADLTVTQNTEMDFASILPPAGGGTATIPKTADTITCVAGGTCTGTVSRGKFGITGTDGSVTISYSDGTLSDGTNTMALDVSSGTINNDTSATISGGTATLNVGGILTIGASQAAGTYNTSNAGGSAYTVTVNY